MQKFAININLSQCTLQAKGHFPVPSQIYQVIGIMGTEFAERMDSIPLQISPDTLGPTIRVIFVTKEDAHRAVEIMTKPGIGVSAEYVGQVE